jgi:hypothetical protein
MCTGYKPVPPEPLVRYFSAGAGKYFVEGKMSSLLLRRIGRKISSRERVAQVFNLCNLFKMSDPMGRNETEPTLILQQGYGINPMTC